MPAENPIDPLSQALELGNRYGGVSAIPPDELATLGYVHIGPGRIAPIGFTPEIHMSMEDKFNQRPFDTISIELGTTGDAYKRISGPELQLLRDDVTELLQVEDEKGGDEDEFGYIRRISTKMFPNQAPFLRFQERFIQFLQASPHRLDTRYITHDVFTSWGFYLSFKHITSEMADSYPLEKYVDTENEDGDILYPDQTEQFAQAFERVISQLADHDIIESNFVSGFEDEQGDWKYITQVIDPDYVPDRTKKMIEDDIFEETGGILHVGSHPDDEVEEDADDYWDRRRRVSEAEGIMSGLQFVTYYFEKFLESHDMGEIGARLREANSVGRAKRILFESIEDDSTLAPLRDSLQSLRTQIKNAPVEQKRELSSHLKDAETRYKEARQLLAGMFQYFDQPTHVAAGIRRIGKHIHDSIRVASKERGTVTLTLDGRPDSNLDRDPGEMSGDCTEGKPLPFAEAHIPAYNTKVYMEGRHLGNMYLLRTKLAGTEHAAWHLDAIQIPSQRIDWSPTSVDAFIAGLATEARKQGITCITVNAREVLISNYDYVGKG